MLLVLVNHKVKMSPHQDESLQSLALVHVHDLEVIPLKEREGIIIMKVKATEGKIRQGAIKTRRKTGGQKLSNLD